MLPWPVDSPGKKTYQTESTGEEVLASEESSNNASDMNFDSLRKLHLRLSHDNESVMRRTIRHAGRTVAGQDLKSTLPQCNCRDTYAKPQNPLVSSYIPSYPAHTICLGVFFLHSDTGEVSPYLLICCALTRFCVVKALSNMRPKTIILMLLLCWAPYYGKAERILADQGPGFIGQEWSTFLRNMEYNAYPRSKR